MLIWVLVFNQGVLLQCACATCTNNKIAVLAVVIKGFDLLIFAVEMDLCVHTVGFIGPGRSFVIKHLLQGVEGLCNCCYGDKALSHFVVTCNENQQLVLYDTPHHSSSSDIRCVLENIARNGHHSLNVIAVCFKTSSVSKAIHQGTRTLRMLQSTFGQRVWNNVVLILSVADQLVVSHDPRKLCNALKHVS